MRDELTLKDFWLFLKDNIKVILLSALTFLLLMVGFVLFNYFTTDTTGTVEQTVEDEEVFDEDFDRLTELPFELLNDREITYLQDYVEENAYRFMFFVETNNNEPVGNLNMMRAIFRHQNVVEVIEERIDESLTPDPPISINVISYADSGLFELQLGRSTRESSEELASAFYDLILGDEIPVLNQFNVTLFEDEPIPLRETIEVEDIDDTIVVERDNAALIRNIVLFSILGVIGGFFVGLGIALIKLYLTRNITALYNYERVFTDKIVRLNHLKNSNDVIMEKAIQNIIYPKHHKKLVMVNKQADNKIEQLVGNLQLEPNIVVVNDFSELDKSELVDEVIIISEVNKTTKQWYTDQRVQLAGYDLPVKIIQL